MTGASELFCNRRSRVGRTSAADLDTFDSSPDLHSRGDGFYNRRHHFRHAIELNRNHRRSDFDNCDPLRQSSDVRHLLHRASQPEHGPVRFDEGTSQYNPGNNVNAENPSSITIRTDVTRNDRLPGAVLLARERLLQRLRGVSVSENRQRSRDSLRVHAEPLDWDAESLMGWLARGTPSTDSSPQNGVPIFSQKPSKPPGLTQEALDCLHLEVFSSLGKFVEGAVSRASRECSICLDSFEDGDKLICLPCEHRFHCACLDPWVRTCGDCPYCRRGIVITSLEDAERT